MKALIFGVSGQDGAYLAQLLLAKGYQVFGTSRDVQSTSFDKLQRLGINEAVSLLSTSLIDFRSVLQTLNTVQPQEVYNLAGQSSVGLSFEQPVETLESITLGTLNILESIRFLERPVKLYSAGSIECFGETGMTPANEMTAFRPSSPYAVAKAASFWEIASYRDAYGLFACTGVLGNHESPLRPARFVTRKITSAACRIAEGSQERLVLGNLNIARDWGWAPDYVDAMWRMLQQEQACDYVIATGQLNTLEAFINKAFEKLGLCWQDHVDIDSQLFRPTDIAMNWGNAQKAHDELAWRPRHLMAEVVDMMVHEELLRLKQGP